MAAIVARAPVIPVLTVDKRETAVPLARALVKGGLPVLEITLRTEPALDALRAIAAEVPEAIVGAGTVLDPAQLDQVQRAGARFAVSPGCTATLARAARSSGIPFLPGVQTVSEAMALAELGFGVLKFFPADAAGGLTWIKAVGAPLPDLRFCPTGGITADTAASYLALANVACVGGSWVAPRVAVATGDWQSVERLAAAASALKRC
ncbi:bifunctional 4-hydroxy-2-oxoglutarate aldolase/2-dehydro-3-deoxy-phosphogluconate aldolase [Reyranella sp.]|uniref:bifunctional 4-hydroxy-2-oxoglutarate aldolase/2-dehydro-3-deoxy-phosphogluconate aldolase n=1 Tax=Reyranella sp. TaxID=1929291 RepID=UPI0025FBEA12|nr:bifunctional 4-hydroxy-2-oxoglutarate aldolase/2-dehydro-3-deoxy-phosphogluconate aldolase [Reyranella sp.]